MIYTAFAVLSAVVSEDTDNGMVLGVAVGDRILLIPASAALQVLAIEK